MYLLRQMSLPGAPIAVFNIYYEVGNRWQYETTFRLEDSLKFYTCMKQFDFDFKYAIIHLETLYRNTLYYIYPHIQIGIHEKAVRSYVSSLLDITPEAFEEIAVSMEYGKSCLDLELLGFVDEFYSFQKKEDALFSYAKWQYERPLNERKLTKFVRIMEFYMDEILNYFDLRSVERQLEF
nr:hypothetical protein [uncultured Cellulosilyticum sp.]